MTQDAYATIRIYLRARPSPRPSTNVTLNADDHSVEFLTPKDKSSGYVNNQTDRHGFMFDRVFNGDATQENVFEEVTLDVLQRSLEGYNGTVFAYGQTGSGKTFTITGGPERYADRGMIPRAISRIFSEAAQKSDHTFTIHVSYLEIYNDTVYDLLDPDREIRDIDDLPRVLVREDENGSLIFGNLRICKVETEEDALSLLFLGDTNRAVSETPLNMASSRSHCIFCLHIQSSKNGDDTVRRSKLNLVDLAGSERIKKTGIDGQTLTESKYINLSLHYLEQVIVALQEDASDSSVRMHIPYRNSAMTLLLRDSLGGNCRTVMIANISLEQRQLDESISTCRFAQRVAMITNEAMVNEEVDPRLVIVRLKGEILDLKQELQMLKGGVECQTGNQPIEKDQQEFKNALISYCQTDSTDEPLNLFRPIPILRYGFQVMREFLWEARKSRPPSIEIEEEKKLPCAKAPMEVNTGVCSEQLRDAFEKSYPNQEILEDNQEQLRLKFAAAKQEGQKLAESKKRMSQLKSAIEQKRRKRVIEQLCSMSNALDSRGCCRETENDIEEQRHLEALTQEKTAYKQAFFTLRDLKKEVESLQSLMEHNQKQKQKAFIQWMEDRKLECAQMHPSRKQRISPDNRTSACKFLMGDSEVDREIVEFYRVKSQIEQQS